MSHLIVHIREKRFRTTGEDSLKILANFELEVAAGQFLSILGPSGCGKTTLLRLVSGLDPDFDGRIELPVTGAGHAPKLAYVFQEPVLLPWRSVIENLHLVMSTDQIARGLAGQLLQAVGLGDVGNAFPGTLSLGMSRRVSLARAFAVEPDVLLMDEPFVSLDENTADRLRDLLAKLWAEKPATVLFVTHDSREAIRMGQRIVVLSRDKPTSLLQDLEVTLDDRERHQPQSIEAVRVRLKRS